MALHSLNLPFSNSRFPVIHLETDRDITGVLRVAVTPLEKTDRVTFELTFDSCIAWRCIDESLGSSNQWLNELKMNSNPAQCCYIWEESPWLNALKREYGELVENLHPGKSMQHYVFLGANINVDIVAPGYSQTT